MTWIRRKLWLWALALLPAGGAGCNPLGMGLLTPVPVPPWTAERLEQKLNHKNDGRVPIMPPILDGVPPPICEDGPAIRKSCGRCPACRGACRISTKPSATTS